MRLGGESVLEVSKAQAGGRFSGYASNGQWSMDNGQYPLTTPACFLRVVHA